MLTVEFDTSGVLTALDRVQSRLRSERAAVLRPIGQDIIARGHADYIVKSRGGTGSDGIAWRRLAPSTIRRKRSAVIGFATGELSAATGDVLDVTSDSVRSGFGDPHAAAFDAIRPLLPARLPPAWKRAEERLVEAWGETILDQELGT